MPPDASPRPTSACACCSAAGPAWRPPRSPNALDTVNRQRQEVEAVDAGRRVARRPRRQAAAGPRGAAGERRRLAPRRGRHRRRTDQGAVQPAGLRRRRGGRGREGLRPLGAGDRPGRGGDRGAPGRVAARPAAGIRWRRGSRCPPPASPRSRPSWTSGWPQAADLPTAADLLVEGALAVPGATTDLAHQVARLAPFGAGNEEPVLRPAPRPRAARRPGRPRRHHDPQPSSRAKAAARG